MSFETRGRQRVNRVNDCRGDIPVTREHSQQRKASFTGLPAKVSVCGLGTF